MSNIKPLSQVPTLFESVLH